MSNPERDNTANGTNIKARLVEQVVELILTDRSLSEKQLDGLCSWLCQDEFAALRDKALKKYYTTHPLSEEASGAQTEELANVRRGWSELAGRLHMDPDIGHYRTDLATRDQTPAKVELAARRSSSKPLFSRMAVRVAAAFIPLALVAGGYLWHNATNDVPDMAAVEFAPTHTVTAYI